MPTTRNVARFPELMGSRTLEKNLLTPLYQTSIIPYYILNVTLIPTVKYRHNPFFKAAL